MSKELAMIQRSDIEQIQIYINTGKLTLRQIVEREKPDLAIEGTFFLDSWKAACHLKVNGQVISNDPNYSTDGYAWDKGSDISMFPGLPGGQGAKKANYITCCRLIVDGKPCNPLYYNADVKGARGRGGMGIKGGQLGFYASTDGVDALTPEQFRDKMDSLGFESFVMHDGGGKVNYYNKATGALFEGKDKSQNLILVYLKKGEGKPVNSKAYTVCLDPGHGPRTVNGSPDGTYKEQEFCWDMYTRIKPLLEKQGINVVGTRGQNEKPSLIDRCKVSDNAKANLFLSLHSDAARAVDNIGWSSASGLHVKTSMGPLKEKRNVAANALLNQFKAAGVAIRGSGLAHNISLVVLAKSAAPACLIEYGFHTNQGDVAKLKNPAYREKLAIATAKGICEYFGVIYQNVTPSQPVMTDRQRVQERFGLNNETMDYLQDYKYNLELLKKLLEGK